MNTNKTNQINLPLSSLILFYIKLHIYIYKKSLNSQSWTFCLSELNYISLVSNTKNLSKSKKEMLYTNAANQNKSQKSLLRFVNKSINWKEKWANLKKCNNKDKKSIWRKYTLSFTQQHQQHHQQQLSSPRHLSNLYFYYYFSKKKW
jgi:hypothetical protein